MFWLQAPGHRNLDATKPAPQETGAFPIEKGVLHTPEEEATAEEEEKERSE